MRVKHVSLGDKQVPKGTVGDTRVWEGKKQVREGTKRYGRRQTYPVGNKQVREVTDKYGGDKQVWKVKNGWNRTIRNVREQTDTEREIKYVRKIPDGRERS